MNGGIPLWWSLFFHCNEMQLSHHKYKCQNHNHIVFIIYWVVRSLQYSSGYVMHSMSMYSMQMYSYECTSPNVITISFDLKIIIDSYIPKHSNWTYITFIAFIFIYRWPINIKYWINLSQSYAKPILLCKTYNDKYDSNILVAKNAIRLGISHQIFMNDHKVNLRNLLMII